MSAAMGSTVVFGLVVGLTPWAIVIVLVLLEAARGPIVAWAFVVGWAGAIAAVGGAVVFGLGSISAGSATEGDAVRGVELVLGAALIAYGTRRLLSRRGAGPRKAAPDVEQPPIPRWLGALDELRPVYAFALGVFWLNYPFVILWGSDVIGADLTSAAYVVLLSCFVALGSSAVAGLAGYASLAPARAQPVVASFRRWMTHNAGAVVSWLALAVGALLVLKGIADSL